MDKGKLSWVGSAVQMIGCHYTDTIVTAFLIYFDINGSSWN
jgi:hypothetical protein